MRGNVCLSCNALEASNLSRSAVVNGRQVSLPSNFAAAISVSEPTKIISTGKSTKQTLEPFPSGIYRHPDLPTEGFSSIEEAVKTIQDGKASAFFMYFNMYNTVAFRTLLVKCHHQTALYLF